MNEEIVQGSNLLFYLVVVALLSGLTFAAWLSRRARKLRARIPYDRSQPAVSRFDR